MSSILSGNALLALMAAGLWGVGDFSGGMGVKAGGATVRAALRFILLSHFISLVLLATLGFGSGAAFPHGIPLLSGLLAGVAGGFALTAFYIALARGAMGTAAAISGLLAAAIPSAVSAVVEGAPGWTRAAGFLTAGVAIWLIGGSDSSRTADRTAAWLAIAGGAGFGLYFVALRYASPAGLVWPMAAARVGSLSTCGTMLLVLRDRAGASNVHRRVAAWALGTALFDTTGNMLFLAATRAGRLDIAAVLASLYPASTILLAAAVLKERPSRRQAFGMAVALAAVVLVAR